jgi:hypothetical protein
MKKYSHPKTVQRPRFSPLTLIVLGLAVLFVISLATHPSAASAKGMAAAPTPPAATPPPKVPPTYPNAPQSGVVGLPAVQNQTGAQLGQDAVISYVHSHRIPFNGTDDRGKVSTIGKFPAGLVAERIGAPTGLPDDTMLWYVEFSGNFAFPGNSHSPQGVTFPYAYEAFNAANGNLVLAGGLAGPTQTPPTPTPVLPTPTPLPATPTTVPPTPTTAPACTIVSQGSATFNADLTYFSFDTGHVSASASGGQIHFASGQFVPANGSTMHDLGVGASFGNVTCAQLQGLSYSSNGIQMANTDVFAVKTANGHFGVAYVSVPPTGGFPSLRYVTYQP